MNQILKLYRTRIKGNRHWINIINFNYMYSLLENTDSHVQHIM